MTPDHLNAWTAGYCVIVAIATAYALDRIAAIVRYFRRRRAEALMLAHIAGIEAGKRLAFEDLASRPIDPQRFRLVGGA